MDKCKIFRDNNRVFLSQSFLKSNMTIRRATRTATCPLDCYRVNDSVTTLFTQHELCAATHHKHLDVTAIRKYSRKYCNVLQNTHAKYSVSSSEPIIINTYSMFIILKLLDTIFSAIIWKADKLYWNLPKVQRFCAHNIYQIRHTICKNKSRIVQSLQNTCIT